MAALVAAVGLCATACSDDADAGADPAPGEFCPDANAFVTDSAVFFVADVDAELFVDLDRRLAALDEIAPTNLGSDIAALRAGFAHIDDAYASVDYDPAASPPLDAETQAATLEASGHLGQYLEAECGLDTVRNTQVEDIMAAFGVERSTAECLHGEMGDVANIDSSRLTPALMTRPTCGTSLFDLLSGNTAPSG